MLGTMRYPGGKGKSYQRIINLMPPHEVYIESHLGGGAVMRHKRPAATNIGIDIDRQVIDAWVRAGSAVCDLVCADAVEYLGQYPFQGHELIYADPPYLPETRRRKRIYRHEYGVDDHVQFLETLSSLPCKVIISGYPSHLYSHRLRGWFYQEYSGVSHAGRRTEALWANFTPRELHDYRYVGNDFRERGRIRRKKERWCNRLRNLSHDERQALLSALQDLGGESSHT